MLRTSPADITYKIEEICLVSEQKDLDVIVIRDLVLSQQAIIHVRT